MPAPLFHFVTINDTAHFVLYCVVYLHCITFRNEFPLLKHYTALRKNDTAHFVLFCVVSCFIPFRFLSKVGEIVLAASTQRKKTAHLVLFLFFSPMIGCVPQFLFILQLLAAFLILQKFLYNFCRAFLGKK